MYKEFIGFMKKWHQSNDARTKLQNTYLGLAVVGIIIAGLVGLVRYELGQILVNVSLICLGVFVCNAIVWALLHGLLLVRLDSLDSKPTAKKSPK